MFDAVKANMKIGIRLLIISLFLTQPLGLWAKQKKIIYDDWVDLDYAHATSGNICLDLSAHLSSGKYFKGLQRIDTAAGFIFKKDKVQVSEFPGKMLIAIRVSGDVCDLHRGASNPSIFPDPIPNPLPEIAKSLVFELYWKQNSELHKVSILETTSSPAVWPERNPPYWLYTFTVDASGIPITDELVICARTPDHKVFSMLNGGLGYDFMPGPGHSRTSECPSN